MAIHSHTPNYHHKEVMWSTKRKGVDNPFIVQQTSLFHLRIIPKPNLYPLAHQEMEIIPSGQWLIASRFGTPRAGGSNLEGIEMQRKTKEGGK